MPIGDFQWSINRAKPVAVKLGTKTEKRRILPQTVEWSKTLKGQTFVYDDQTQKEALIFAFSRHCNGCFYDFIFQATNHNLKCRIGSNAATQVREKFDQFQSNTVLNEIQS